MPPGRWPQALALGLGLGRASLCPGGGASDRRLGWPHARCLLRRTVRLHRRLAGAGSVSEAVAAAVRVVRESGLPHRTDSMFTTVEGEWDECMDVVRRACEAVGAYGPRVSLVLKADIRPGHTGELTGKLDRLEAAIERADGVLTSDADRPACHVDGLRPCHAAGRTASEPPGRRSTVGQVGSRPASASLACRCAPPHPAAVRPDHARGRSCGRRRWGRTLAAPGDGQRDLDHARPAAAASPTSTRSVGRHGLTFARYEALVLLAFSRDGRLPHEQDRPAADGPPDQRHQHHPAARRAGLRRARAQPRRRPRHPRGRSPPAGREVMEARDRATWSSDASACGMLDAPPSTSSSSTCCARSRVGAGDFDA